MIVTCKKQIPFSWMLVALLPWSALTVSWQVTGNAVTFSLKKFLENPATLTFILTLPSFLSLVTITVTNFMSDRIWTSVGRRKPFVLIGFIGMAVCFVIMPLAPNFWSLVVVYLLLNIFMDLNSPIESLKQEIVPPHQRGTATGIMYWINQVAQLLFMFFIFGRFDDVRFMDGVAISGETGIYWSAALMAISMSLLIALGIKETKQNSPLTGQRLTFKTFFGGLADRELLPVYILIFGQAVIYSSTGPLGALLYTEQWGYTKQDMGTNIAIGGVLNLFIIAGLTYFADKLDRLKAYQALILIYIGLSISYYCYVQFLLPDRRPSLLEIVLFGEMMSITGILLALVFTPLIYDYIVRNKMGTYVAGQQLVSRLTQIVTVNGAGLFIVWYAVSFQPPAGEMTRVVLRDPATVPQVQSWLEKTAITDPATGQPRPSGDLHFAIWNGDGTVSNQGRGIEVRLRNEASEEVAKERRAVLDELTPLLDYKKSLENRHALFINKGDVARAQQELSRIADQEPKLAELQNILQELDGKLALRAASLQKQLQASLGDKLAVPGDQILSARSLPLGLVRYVVQKSPSRRSVDNFLVDARSRIPEIVDVRYASDSKHLEAVFVPQSDQSTQPPADVLKVFEELARKVIPGVLAQTVPPKFEVIEGLQMTLATVEDPVPLRVSPVTSAVHFLQRWIGFRMPSDARVLSAARSLRTPGSTPFAGMRASTEQPQAVILTVGLVPSATPAGQHDDITQRLMTLSPGAPAAVPALRDLYDRAVTALAKQRLTVRQPVLAASYVPVKYDYLAGNILTIFLSFIGFGITMVFYYLNKKGYIRKLGAEEAEATE